MIIFQQICNATVKLKYPGGTFMIVPWLTDACDPIEREQAVAMESGAASGAGPKDCRVVL